MREPEFPQSLPNGPDGQGRQEERDDEAAGLTRRNLLRWGALAGAAAPLAGLAGAAGSAAAASAPTPLSDAAIAVVEATVAEMQAAMEGGGTTARNLVDAYLERIATLDQAGPNVN